MKYYVILLFIFIGLLAATACTPKQPTPVVFSTATLPPTATPWPTSVTLPVTSTPTTDPSIFAQLFPNSNTGNELTRIDEQGMVIVEVTPLNLGMPGDTLDFDVSLNTHSIELTMDIAQLASLTTDTGIVVQAILWDAPRGGHHVSGRLMFPASKDGIPILSEATMLTLEITDLDAALRTFVWILE